MHWIDHACRLHVHVDWCASWLCRGVSSADGEHPLDSRKRRSNFASVSTLGVGYALRWYLNHRPNFILFKIASVMILPDSLLTASWQPPDSYSKTFAGFYFWDFLCHVSILVCWLEKMCLGKRYFFSWQRVDSLTAFWQPGGVHPLLLCKTEGLLTAVYLDQRVWLLVMVGSVVDFFLNATVNDGLMIMTFVWDMYSHSQNDLAQLQVAI